MAPQSVPHLLSIQGSVVQAGHAALEAEFRHPIVDQQEVPQLEEKGTKGLSDQGAPTSAFPRTDRAPRPTSPALGPLALRGPAPQTGMRAEWKVPKPLLAATHVSQLLLMLLLHPAPGARPPLLP